uniref:Uncharacterized protein n=1 Tax=Tetranychus urticae TaxID=32264 RepID=T1L5U3_TETUR
MPENDKENVNSSTPNIPTDSDNVSPPPTSESVTPTIPNANLNNSLEVYRDPKLDDLLHPRLNISPTPGTHNKNDELSDLHKMDNGDDTLSSVNDLSTVSVTDNLPNLLDYLDADDLLDLPGLDPFGNQPNTITSRGAMVLATLARDVIKVRLEEINQKSVVKVKDAALQTDC